MSKFNAKVDWSPYLGQVAAGSISFNIHDYPRRVSLPKLSAFHQISASSIPPFFRLKVSDDARAIMLKAKNNAVHARKLALLSKNFRRLQAAVQGDVEAFNNILDIAYGRKGKLRWELIEPLMSQPDILKPPRIISAVEKSRPPVYSPELQALLTSPISRVTKPISPKCLTTPSTMPAQADPTSKDALLLGPFSKRREVNIRWRYISDECKKVLPPLPIVLDNEKAVATSNRGASIDDIVSGGHDLGLQGRGIDYDLAYVVGPLWVPAGLTRKEKRFIKSVQTISVCGRPRHPSRWVRRRFRSLLSRLPILQPYPRTDHMTGIASVIYKVEKSPLGIGSSDRQNSTRLPEIDHSSLAWYNLT